MAQDTYTVYQIKGGEEFRDYRFESLEDLRHFGLKLRPEIYDEIYTGMVPEGGSVDRKLEKIYEQLNLHHPEDYRGHSLSVSDVVVLHQNGVDTAHFVESFGFMEVPSFQQYLEQNAGEWQVYIIPDLMTWATNAANRTEIEYYDTFDAAAARFNELRGQPYNGETALRPDGEAYARLTMGVQTRDNMAALDLLQVRQGQNYLVEDYTRSERVGQSNTVKGILTRIAAEIGFDRVQGYETTPKGTYRLEPDMSFTEWAQQHTPGFTVPDNPLRTAELSVEQNYNHIDGVFNNIAVEEQAAFTLGDAGYLAVQAGEDGWDYTFYNKEHRTVDGGQLDEPGLTMRQAVMQLLYDAGVPDETVQLTDYHGLMDAAEKAEQAAVAQARQSEEESPLLRVMPAEHFGRYLLSDDMPPTQLFVQGGIALTPCETNPDYYESTNRTVDGKHIDAHIYEVAERDSGGQPVAFRIAEEPVGLENPYMETLKMVQIEREGVLCGLGEKHEEAGFMLNNGMAVLETERDAYGNYYGGAYMSGMMLKTEQRFSAVRDDAGKTVAFCQLRRREPLQKSAERPSIREQLARKAAAPKPKPPAPHKNTPER